MAEAESYDGLMIKEALGRYIERMREIIRLEGVMVVAVLLRNARVGGCIYMCQKRMGGK